ncbi:COP23 domain-containing protein [Phormidesmis sp. 146-33]
MKLWNHYFLVLLGTLSFLSLTSQQSMAAELQSSKDILTSQASPQTTTEPSIPAQPASTVPEIQQPERIPVLPTPDSELLSQKAPVLPTPDTPEPVSTPTVVRQPTQRPQPISVASTSSEVISAPVEVASTYESSTSEPSTSAEDAPVSVSPPEDAPRTPSTMNQSQGTKKLNKLGQLTFVCGSDNGTPKTIAKLNNRELGVILWTSTAFNAKGFDPQTRCKQVSARFEEYNKANQLVYLTSGKLNGQVVICATTKEAGGCGDISPYDGLLFTLQPKSNGQEVLEQLSNALAIEDNTPTEPLKE